MNISSQPSPRVIDLSQVCHTLFLHWRRYVYVLSATFVISCLLVLSVPRYYRCEVALVPEQSEQSGSFGGSLSALASSFGLNVGNNTASADAIPPLLYPKVMESTDFLVGMFNVKVQLPDGHSTTYYDYLKKVRRYPWWTVVYQSVKRFFLPTPPKEDSQHVDAFRLTREQTDIAKLIADNITCAIDKKTDIITITAEDQSPVLAAALADSARIRLQKFITDYRTNKARKDLDYAKKLHEKAKEDYVRARQVYASYSDAHQDLVLESFQSKTEDLENEMQLKYNIYTSTATQLQMAYAKVQENTPVFTTLERATVPLKPAGPKRMLIVGGMLVLVFILTSISILFRKA